MATDKKFGFNHKRSLRYLADWVCLCGWLLMSEYKNKQHLGALIL